MIVGPPGPFPKGQIKSLCPCQFIYNFFPSSIIRSRRGNGQKGQEVLSPLSFKIDIFRPYRKPASFAIVIFIHGGIFQFPHFNSWPIKEFTLPIPSKEKESRIRSLKFQNKTTKFSYCW